MTMLPRPCGPGGDSSGAFDVAGDVEVPVSAPTWCRRRRRARRGWRGEFAVAEEAPLRQTPTRCLRCRKIDEEKDEDEFAEADACGARRSSLRNVLRGAAGKRNERPMTERKDSASVMATIPRRMALPMRRAIRMATRMSPAAARDIAGRKFCETDESGRIGDDNVGVAQADESDKEADAAAVPYLRQSGMPLTICSRILVSVRMRRGKPERKDDTRASPGYARPRTME